MSVYEVYRTTKDIHDPSKVLGFRVGEFCDHLFTADSYEAAKTLVDYIAEGMEHIKHGPYEFNGVEIQYYTFNACGRLQHYLIVKPTIFTMNDLKREENER